MNPINVTRPEFLYNLANNKFGSERPRTGEFEEDVGVSPNLTVPVRNPIAFHMKTF